MQKDLGIIVDKELKFHEQTAAAVKKTIYTKNKITIPLLYMPLVKPLLEYANAMWGPHYKMDKQKIERVQRRATKLIEDIKHLSYEERLYNLNMPSLQRHRSRGDMIDTYKIVTGIYDVDKETFFKPVRELGTRGHCHKLYNQHAGSFLKHKSFGNRVVNDTHHRSDECQYV